jgi:IPT/TIG domain
MKRIIPVIVITVSASVFLFLAMPSAGAAVPTITSFSPTSGPAGCVVVITGTSFTDFPAAQTTVTFVSPAAVETPATPFVIVSATEIWATVPGLTAGTSYTIRVANPAGTSTSTGTFLSTSGAGACAPTISSFSPLSGAVGTAVTIVGTNLLQDVNTGGDVTFFDNKTAAPTGGPVSPAQLSVLVPDGATTGAITVTTPTGTATSATIFTVVGGPTPGGSSIEVFTSTDPGVCHGNDKVGTEPVALLPTAVQVAQDSDLVVYFTSTWSAPSGSPTELLLTLQIEGGEFFETSPEWIANTGTGGSERDAHGMGTVMWSFPHVATGDYTAEATAHIAGFPGTSGQSGANLQACALTVFVIPVAP